LGGNRKGKSRKYINLLIAMTICGFWHGAAWTFVLWGFIHGILLVVNHLWKEHRYSSISSSFYWLYSMISWLLTFLAVTFCWIIFRSDNLNQAFEIFQKLFVFNNNGVAWYHPFVIFIIITTVLVHILYLKKAKIFMLPLESRMTPAMLFCLMWLVVVFFPKKFQPFVYAQF
jgi:alginate O-acetyltransferase complex protein AlgI